MSFPTIILNKFRKTPPRKLTKNPVFLKIPKNGTFWGVFLAIFWGVLWANFCYFFGCFFDQFLALFEVDFLRIFCKILHLLAFRPESLRKLENSEKSWKIPPKTGFFENPYPHREMLFFGHFPVNIWLRFAKKWLFIQIFNLGFWPFFRTPRICQFL